MKRLLATLLCMGLAFGAGAALGEAGIDVAMDGVVEGLQEADDLLETDLDLALMEEMDQEASEVRSNDFSESSVVVKGYIAYALEGDEVMVLTADKKKISQAKIKSEINGYPVTSIAPEAFIDCKKLWSVIIPDTVTEIGDYAFSGCDQLSDVEIPYSVTSIGEGAFLNCAAISHIDLPEGLAEIRDNTFEGCSDLWRITIPSTVEKIGSEAFYRCQMLKQFTLPKSLKVIGESAFEFCTRISKLVIPSGVEVIQAHAFDGCTNLNSLTVSSGVVEIEPYAFFLCEEMTTLKLPTTLESIGRFAFAHIYDLRKVAIPGSVETVEACAFFDCSRLEEVVLDNGVETVEKYAFAQCKSLVNVAVPATVTTIGEDAFSVGTSYEMDEEEMALNAPIRNPKKMKLYGRPGTAAEQYASAHSIPFEKLKIQVRRVSFAEGKSATLYVGNKMALTPVVEPVDAETALKWRSSSSSILKVSQEGLLTPKRAGKATVTVKTENGKTATFEVKVIDAKKVVIEQGKNVTLKVGETLQLSALVTPEQVKTTLTWSSGKKSVASVSSTGLVKARKAGKATITVKTANGRKETIHVKVVK